MTKDKMLHKLCYLDLLKKRGVDKAYAQELADRIVAGISAEKKYFGDVPSIHGEGCIGRDLSSEYDYVREEL